MLDALMIIAGLIAVLFLVGWGLLWVYVLACGIVSVVYGFLADHTADVERSDRFHKKSLKWSR
jgi:hypothetical protein